MNNLKQMLIEHEGLRLRPYQCSAGKLTIGVGRNLEDRGISSDEALMLFDNDMKDAIKDAMTLKWFPKLNPARQGVIVDMIFNLGLGRFLLFKKTTALMAVGDYEGAAAEMLNSKWAGQVGKRATRLAQMMTTGKWV